MKRILRSAVSLLLCAAVALGGTACGRSKLPTTITIWTYYNGDQLECFNQLVEQFNSTVGKEKNIRVESSSQGSVNDLETSVLAAAEGKVGAEKLPNIVSSYADTAFTLDQMGLAVDLSPYLTEKEKSAYIAGFLEEGDLMNNGELKVFPIAKSTELLYLNVTDFVPFAEATGVTYADLSTVEGLNEAAHKYYDWTDAQTAAPNDGKALYGRDALTNYLLCGAQELGTAIFDAENGVMTLHFDKPTLRRLWDNYYVPYIKGWCSASGKFRSDDIKIGSLLAYVGSSSSASFFPTQVLTSDTESHGIEMAALPCPSFAGCEPVAVQQGAGMVVIPGTEDEISACVAFLKWFTQPENTLHSPAQVMQLAHETGRLYEIERITVFHSSEIFQRLQAQGLLQSDALLFINSIANVSLTVEDVEEYAQRYPELLKRLVVEITEQEDLDRACLERKRNIPGFSGSFALDDYGSGYSNELNLLELSPRYIKIDISIVRGIDTDRDKQQIVSNIVAYAHARSMQLIAEGIETEAQLRTVIGLGVDLLQGYYLSRPAAVPAPIAPAAQAVIDQLEHQRFNPLGL